MPFITLEKDEWTTITEETESGVLLQNRSSSTIMITTEATEELALDEGLGLPPNASMTFPAGVSLSGCCIKREGKVLLMPLTAIEDDGGET